MARLSRNLVRFGSSAGEGRYSTTSSAHRAGLLTPALLSAASISFSDAVFADTFPAAGWAGLATAGGLVGAADVAGVLSACVVDPPQAAVARTIAVAAQIKESLGLVVISSFPFRARV